MNVADIVKQIKDFKAQASGLNLSEEEEKQYIEQMSQTVLGGGQWDQQGWEQSLGESRLIAQEQAKDVQANAAPSLPSISNVGSFAPTGVVNWNAIPGGFQPLPQTAGGKKKLYQLSQFHGGINQRSSPRDIADFECQEATNVTFSEIGRIKLLGDCLNQSNSLKEFAGITAVNFPGYGLFEFTAPADPSGAVTGEQVILLTADGDQVDALCDKDNDGGDDTTAGWIDMPSGSDDSNTAQIYYAAGNGLYVTDANFGHTGVRGCRVYVDRSDFNQTITTRGWSSVASTPLITSPKFIDSGLDGDISAAANAKVTLEWDDGSAPDLASGTDGAAAVHIGSTGTGTWNGNYYFYISWLFDGGVETGLTSLILNGDTAPPFVNETLSFNFSIKNVDSGGTSGTNYMGGDIRIEGARIYFKESGTSERWLLAEVSLIDGVKGALDSTYVPWDHNSDVYDLAANIIFVNPPEVYSYASLNGYYANEVYKKSGDTIADDTDGPAPLSVRYKTCVVGQAGVVFIGNVMFDGRHMPDSMMFSMPGKPAVFPKFNVFDSPSSDGSGITALAAFQDKILQFKQNAMYVINVSNPAQFYAQSSFRDCGVFNPSQVFTTSFGVIFVNKNGCFIFDGQKVISLSGGKFDWLNQAGVPEATSNASTAQVPCIGYDPRSQNIIILKNIGDNSTDEGAWVYNMTTQSWTEGSDMIINADNTRHTNFIITSEGYLSIKNNGDPTLLNYKEVDNVGQDVIYWTKDLDFGLPSQTKKLFKVYITYKGDCDNLVCAYGVDGETDTSDLYHFSIVSAGGTTDTTPLLDKSSAANLESWHVATLYPDDITEGKGWKSISLYFSGAVDDTFEINDISILYRVRPVK